MTDTVPAQTEPIFVGGVGGSGTRLVASLLHSMGLFMGAKLNDSWDNLEFPGCQRFLPRTPFEPPRLLDDELNSFARTMEQGAQRAGRHRWGTKFPPCFLVLDRLHDRFPDMRYVHVVRSGFDMAYSANLNQLRKWGRLFDVEPGNDEDLPTAALTYWIRANQYTLESAARVFDQENFIVVRYECLVTEPTTAIDELAGRLGLACDRSPAELASQVRDSNTIGRHLERGTPENQFPLELVLAARRLSSATS